MRSLSLHDYIVKRQNKDVPLFRSFFWRIVPWPKSTVHGGRASANSAVSAYVDDGTKTCRLHPTTKTSTTRGAPRAAPERGDQEIVEQEIKTKPSFLLLTCSPVPLSRPKAVRGPKNFRAANPRRLLFGSPGDQRSKKKRRGVAPRLNSGPRISMRGFLHRAGRVAWMLFGRRFWASCWHPPGWICGAYRKGTAAVTG